MTPEDKAARQGERSLGNEASRIFDSRAWTIAYESVAKKYTDVIFHPSTPDEDMIEAKKRLLLLHDLKNELARIMQTGQLARVQLETENERKRA